MHHMHLKPALACQHLAGQGNRTLSHGCVSTYKSSRLACRPQSQSNLAALENIFGQRFSQGNGHRWPFGKIDGPGKWNKPHPNQGPLTYVLSKPNKKDTYGNGTFPSARGLAMDDLPNATAQRRVRSVAITARHGVNAMKLHEMLQNAKTYKHRKVCTMHLTGYYHTKLGGAMPIHLPVFALVNL